MDSILIAWGDLAVGDEVAAADGYLFTVREVVKETATMRTLRIGSDFSPMKEIRDGVLKTMKKSSRVRGFKAERTAEAQS